MVGSRYWESVQVFLESLQAAVSRVTPANLLVHGPFSPGEPVGQIRLSEAMAPLGRQEIDRSLSIALRFRVVSSGEGGNRWAIQAFASSYLLFHGDREEIGYHWDDEATETGGIRTPHVHFGKDLAYPELPREHRDRLGTLAAAHMPTGLISFTEIFRTAIRDLGVEPLRRAGESPEDASADAERCFREAEAALVSSFAWRNNRIA